ncbi:Murein hydrolase activator NlpD precursor [Actinomyces bovis]|uniref:Murein hydrolase activator NlpD n=1 Tax=Actinomyces bovis TaxID=1658 RepID=A0ABY1VNA9_9ACTO|nr:peptidoglycan DD-metalloendopeptidase family protein [Actinomyces bovis]SPT53480.1 Murein hydrolase activator NlpD precursor [Actinomyces bovis]VEG55361.1 Murein hydrolase activator NlpD precursor [Actinomyces israelii]
MKARNWVTTVLVGPLMAMLALMMASGGESQDEEAKKIEVPTLQTGTGLSSKVPEAYRALIERAATVCPEITAPLLASQLAQESGFNPNATSPVGAQGIAQFMPGTWATAGRDGDGDGIADVWNPADAIWSQAHYMCNNVASLKGLAGAGRVSGDLIDLALAAYNAGLGNVIAHGGVPPFAETTNYIRVIKARMAEFTAPAPLVEEYEPGQGGEWKAPASGPITSPFGYRLHPILGYQALHEGTDLNGGGCGGPIYAAAGGTVKFAGMDDDTGTVTIAHGGGVSTSYLHVPESGIFVKVGDTVTAGQRIAVVGSTGRSTACHLHFEVRINGQPTDPVPFMAQRGVPLR